MLGTAAPALAEPGNTATDSIGTVQVGSVTASPAATVESPAGSAAADAPSGNGVDRRLRRHQHRRQLDRHGAGVAGVGRRRCQSAAVANVSVDVAAPVTIGRRQQHRCTTRPDGAGRRWEHRLELDRHGAGQRDADGSVGDGQRRRRVRHRRRRRRHRRQRQLGERLDRHRAGRRRQRLDGLDRDDPVGLADRERVGLRARHRVRRAGGHRRRRRHQQRHRLDRHRPGRRRQHRH